VWRRRERLRTQVDLPAYTLGAVGGLDVATRICRLRLASREMGFQKSLTHESQFKIFGVLRLAGYGFYRTHRLTQLFRGSHDFRGHFHDLAPLGA
jgi:hypothetical protein